jgi:hypothetical protein
VLAILALEQVEPISKAGSHSDWRSSSSVCSDKGETSTCACSVFRHPAYVSSSPWRSRALGRWRSSQTHRHLLPLLRRQPHRS